MNDQKTRPDENRRPDRTFLLHVGLVVFVGVYFGLLIWWFGSLFAGGGSEEHAVLGVVIPLVVGLGGMAVGGFTVIALEGRKASRKKSDKF